MSVEIVRRACALASVACALGCGGDPSPSDAGAGDAARNPTPFSLSVSPSITGFEGQRRFVALLGSAFGDDDLRGATIRVNAGGTGFTLDQHVCTRGRCAIVAHIDDRIPNRGVPVPSNTDGRAVEVFVAGLRYDYRAVLSVLPLDRADADSNAAGRLAPTAVYSGLEVPAGMTLRPALDATGPLRIVVMGAIHIGGRIDLSPDGDTVLAGGGAAGHDAMAGGNEGGAGHARAGGGGGFARAGATGRAGTAMGGAGGAARAESLDALVGGSGGGGTTTGVGGAGGGAMLLAGFDTADFTGATLVSHGGAGRTGGGGGSGGAFLLSATAWTGNVTLDVGGGAGATDGDATGGDGAPGRVRLDGPPWSNGLDAASRVTGLAFDATMTPAVVRDAMVPVGGWGAPGTRLRVREDRGDDHVTATATVGADGTWRVSVPLAAGGQGARFVLTRLDASDRPMGASFSGTTLVSHTQGSTQVIDSGALDVVFLPNE